MYNKKNILHIYLFNFLKFIILINNIIYKKLYNYNIYNIYIILFIYFIYNYFKYINNLISQIILYLISNIYFIHNIFLN